MRNILMEACREMHKLTKRQVAHKLGIPAKQYYELESSKMAMTLDVAEALEKLYNIKWFYFLEASRQLETLRAKIKIIKTQKDEIARLKRVTKGD